MFQENNSTENQFETYFIRNESINNNPIERINVSNDALEVGHKHPIFISNLIWNSCVDWDNDWESIEQSESTRLHTLLNEALAQVNHDDKKDQSLHFNFTRIPQKQTIESSITLKLQITYSQHSERKSSFIMNITRPWE